MSLTNPSNISERKIKSIIKSIIPNKENFYSLDNSKCFDTKKPLVVPSSLEKTHAALCGTAFDYLARFFIASKINSNNKESVLQNLVAERLISGRTDFYTIKIDKELMKNTDKIDSTADIFEIDICGSPSTYLINLLNIDKAALSEMRKKEFIRATFLSMQLN